MEVTKPPLALLDLRLEKKDGLSVASEPSAVGSPKRCRKAVTPTQPGGSDSTLDGVVEDTTSCYEAEVEQSHLAGQITLRRTQNLVKSALLVPHVETRIPERREQLRSQLREEVLRETLRHHEKIDIRVRAEHLATVAARRYDADGGM